MGIQIDKEKKLFTLTTKHSAYQMKVDELGVLRHHYYGKKVAAEDLGYLLEYGDVGFSGNPYDAGKDRTFSLDTLPQEYTGSGVGDYRIKSIEVNNSDGTDGVDLRYKTYQIEQGKYEIPGQPALYGGKAAAATLIIVMEDKVTNLEVSLYYSVWESFDVITRAVKITNKGTGAIKLQKASSMCLDFPYGKMDMMHFYGRQLLERQAERIPLFHGIQSVGSTRGSSSHQHNPFVILCEPDAGEDYGCCYGVSLIYSGNFEAQIEVDQMEQVRMVMGVHSQSFTYQLEPGEAFYTPEVMLTFSGSGFTPMSQQIHKIYREHLCRGKYKKKRRPVLLNNWEATYFDFDEQKILEIASGAAELGVEMIVLDDGWFGKRDSDCSGLGDWDVNTDKLKGGLQPLVEQVNQMGLQFGIWVEPEMISEDSELYRAHPEWALAMPGRNPNRSRYQLVLDMSREDVREYLYDKIHAILTSANIEYVKWDMNRSICDFYSALLPSDRQGEAAHRYILGLYDLLDKITSNHPDILLEGCSGGGGRFDPGMLYYSPQIWCSDDTDAVERVKIQYGTSFGYPISAVGSHVSAVPNHQTGRITPLETRGAVAMAGSFGYELDLNTLTESEKEGVKEQIVKYKEYYELIHEGDYYRLNDPMKEDYAVWSYVSEDRREALVHGVRIKARPNVMHINVKLKGLDPKKRYQVEGEKRIYSGSVLMNCGILFNSGSGDYQMMEIKLSEVK